MKNTMLMIIILIVKSVINATLHCRHCDEPFSSTELYVDQHSNEALNKDQQSKLQLFKNKAGKYFKLLTVSQANLSCQSSFYTQDSFYPGYMWSICLCPRCQAHLGWMFYPNNSKCSLKKDPYKKHKCEGRSLFYGVILENVQTQSMTFSEKIEL